MAGLYKKALQATSLLTLCGFTTVSAQASAAQQVLTVAFLGYDNQSVDASVVAVQGQATTLSVACPPGTDDTDCGIAATQSVIIGPSTYSVYAAEDTAFIFTAICTFSGSSNAVCDESAGGSEANFPGSSTTTYGPTDISYFPVTVTAGANLLSGGGATASGTTASGTAAAGSSMTTSGASVTGSVTANTASHTSAGAVTSSTGTATAATTSGSASTASGSATTSASSTSTSNAAVANAFPSSGFFGGMGLLAYLLALW